jgi:hypothetical protein
MMIIHLRHPEVLIVSITLNLQLIKLSANDQTPLAPGIIINHFEEELPKQATATRCRTVFDNTSIVREAVDRHPSLVSITFPKLCFYARKLLIRR